MAAPQYPFGSGQVQILTPSPHPPGYGYRVIPGRIWWRRVYWLWREYLALRAVFRPASPPWLAPVTSVGVHVTDEDSMDGLLNPGAIARRVGLLQRSFIECSLHGCAVVKFQIPTGLSVVHPTPYPGNPPGLTVGGAREWLINTNIRLDDSMKVIFFDMAGASPRYFELPL